MGTAKLSVSPEQQAADGHPHARQGQGRPARHGQLHAQGDRLRRPAGAGRVLTQPGGPGGAVAEPRPTRGPILDAFYGERALGVRTALGLTLNVDRLNVAADQAKGGGGGGRSRLRRGARQLPRHRLLERHRRHRRQRRGPGGRDPARQPDHLAARCPRAQRPTRWSARESSTSSPRATCSSGRSRLASSWWATRPPCRLWSTTTPTTSIDATGLAGGHGLTPRSAAEPERDRPGAHDRAEVTWNVTAEDADRRPT